MSGIIKATVRKKLGTRHAKRLRLQGRIPASIQGEGKQNLDVSIDESEFLALRRHHEHVFDIEIEGGKPNKSETALIRELQWDTIGERIMHVEFRRVVRGRKTEVEVELEFIGHPKGGVINHLVTHVTIRALPRNIPDGILVKVDDLGHGDQLFARDLELPQGVELAVDPDLAIANVTVPRGIEEVAVAAEAAPEAVEAAAEAKPGEPGAEEPGATQEG